MKHKKLLLLPLVTIYTLIGTSVITSCNKKNTNIFNTEYDNQYYLDMEKYVNEIGKPDEILNYSNQLGKFYCLDWYNSLSRSDWNYDSNGNPINLYCSSEQQAIALYCNAWGDFWNVELHQNKEPTDKLHYMQPGGQIFVGETLGIRGRDYKYMSNALSRAEIKENTILYHGLEFMENEFWDQLKDYIKQNSDGSYDYSKCINKTIKSYGFLSTTLSKSYVVRWCDGLNWINNKLEPPLKEPFVFRIFVPKGTKGIGYVSDFDLVGTINWEQQFIINIQKEFKIINYYKEDATNFFDVLIQ